MHKKKSNVLIAVAILWCVLLLFPGCQKRYWYRTKFNFFGIKSHKTTSIQVNMVNLSQHYISPSFESAVRDYCLQRLSKKGYECTQKDTPEIDMVVYLRVDSFHSHYNKAVLMGFTQNRQPIYNHYDIERDGMQLFIDYKMVRARSSSRYWDGNNQLFFFNSPAKDLRRSKSVIKFDLKKVPETN